MILRKNTVLTGFIIFFLIDCILRIRIKRQVTTASLRRLYLDSKLHDAGSVNNLTSAKYTVTTEQVYTFTTTRSMFAQADIREAAERLKRTQTQLYESCKQLPDNAKRNSTGRMRSMVNPSKTIVYCLVNKAASTFIKSSSATVFNCSYGALLSSSHDFNILQGRNRTDVLNKGFKFMFVREPYGRIFSTYCNKFYFPKDHWGPIGPEIVQIYRENPSHDALTYGHNLTFAEIIRYTVDQFEAGKKLDKHLSPMNVMCSPCFYHYDFIGKLETMPADWKLLLAKLTNKGLIDYKTNDISVKDNTIFFILKHILLTRNIIRNSNISLHNIYLRAWSYYQITGVLANKFSMPFKENDNIDHDVFIKQLKTAIKNSEIFSQELRRQRQEALLQAYSTVPRDLLERLTKIVYEDCLLFGYDERPPWLFAKTATTVDQSRFNYFKGIRM